MDSSLTQLFLDLVKIPSPSGREAVVGNFIKSYLKKSKIDSFFDDSGKKNQSDSGNLIAKIKGENSLPTLLFVAHMDTVETGEKHINSKIRNGKITSDGTTILGADNKSSVACLMEVLSELKKEKNRPTVIVAFTTEEEGGIMGSSLLNISEKIDYCFNLDGPNVLGDFVYKTLGEVPFEIKIIGRAAHAAIEPEKGINAIIAAAKLIEKLPIGKDKGGAVLNIGKINGGVANNVVPGEVLLSGQARAYSQEELEACLGGIEAEVKSVCKKTGCSYDFVKKPKEGAPPASINKEHRIVGLAESSAKSLGVKFSLSEGSYTSDANFLSLQYPTLTIGRGSKNPHSFDESITIDDLKNLKKMIKEIVHAAINEKV